MAVLQASIPVLLREFALRATHIARGCDDTRSVEMLDQLSCDLMDRANDFDVPLAISNP